MKMQYPGIDFIYLNEEDMIQVGVRNMPGCIDAMEKVLKCLNRGDYMMGGPNHNSHGTQLSFPKTSPFPNMPLDEGDDRRFMAMPAYVGGEFDMVGVKWYGSNVKNKKYGLPRSVLTVMLSDKDTGAPRCLMSANILSAVRTGAVPGVGAKYLACPSAHVCAVCGPGVMGRTSLDAMMTVCHGIDTLKVKGRSRVSLQKYVNEEKKRWPQLKKVEAVDSVEELVKDADIIIFSNTGGTDPSEYPFIQGEWLKKGALIIGLSAFNMDAGFMAERCRLVVDNRQLYEAWAEEFPYPSFGPNNIIGSKFTDMIHDGIISRNDMYDLGDIIYGKVKGREDPDQIIIYSVGGMPVEDVAWGAVCYRNALKNGIGTTLKLWEQPELV